MLCNQQVTGKTENNATNNKDKMYIKEKKKEAPMQVIIQKCVCARERERDYYC